MFWRVQKEEVTFAHEFAEAIKKRLLITTFLGVLTVLSTGITAAFGYYTKDLPQTIKGLTVSVDSLRQTVEEQSTINKHQDYVQDKIEKRLDRLEDGYQKHKGN